MGARLFCYGSLCDPACIAGVIGRVPPWRRAVLQDHAAFHLRGLPYPGLVASKGGRCEGLLYEGLSARELARLDAYEGAMYRRRRVQVRVGPVHCACWTYMLRRRFRRLRSATPWRPQIPPRRMRYQRSPRCSCSARQAS